MERTALVIAMVLKAQGITLSDTELAAQVVRAMQIVDGFMSGDKATIESVLRALEPVAPCETAWGAKSQDLLDRA